MSCRVLDNVMVPFSKDRMARMIVGPKSLTPSYLPPDLIEACILKWQLRQSSFVSSQTRSQARLEWQRCTWIVYFLMKSYGPGHGPLVTFILGLFIKISMRYQDKCVNESEHLIAKVALGDDEGS